MIFVSNRCVCAKIKFTPTEPSSLEKIAEAVPTVHRRIVIMNTHWTPIILVECTLPIADDSITVQIRDVFYYIPTVRLPSTNLMPCSVVKEHHVREDLWSTEVMGRVI